MTGAVVVSPLPFISCVKGVLTIIRLLLLVTGGSVGTVDADPVVSVLLLGGYNLVPVVVES